MVHQLPSQESECFSKGGRKMQRGKTLKLANSVCILLFSVLFFCPNGMCGVFHLLVTDAYEAPQQAIMESCSV